MTIEETETFERKYIRLTIIYSRLTVWYHTVGTLQAIVPTYSKLTYLAIRGEKEKAHEKEQCKGSSREKFRS